MSEFNGKWTKHSITGISELLELFGKAHLSEKAENIGLDTHILHGSDGKWKIARKYLQSGRTMVNEFTAGDEASFETLKANIFAKFKTSFDGERLLLEGMERDFVQELSVEDGKLKEVLRFGDVKVVRYSFKNEVKETGCFA